MKPGRPRGRQREVEREQETGIAWYMIDDEGFVLPRFREHVAALRKLPDMCNIGEVIDRTRKSED